LGPLIVIKSRTEIDAFPSHFQRWEGIYAPAVYVPRPLGREIGEKKWKMMKMKAEVDGT